MSDVLKGWDIMVVFHFYNGVSIQQLIPDCSNDEEGCANVVFSCLGKTWAAFDNGVIRQTKDVEKVVWSYC